MPFEILRNDITNMNVDVIVNAANTNLLNGSGVCGAIFKAAGLKELQAECDLIGYCNTGEAVITKGYNLNAKYVIHAVGPIYKTNNLNQEKQLYNAYYNSLKLATKYNCKSIAFPLISAGVYGYPKDQALSIATKAIDDYLKLHDLHIYLVVFDKKSFKISKTRFKDIKKYIDDNYADLHKNNYSNRSVLEFYDKKLNTEVEYEEMEEIKLCEDSICESFHIGRSLDDVISNLDESFSQMLLRLIDEKGLTDVETYKRANIDRKLFSKIRNKVDYTPKRTTAVAFAIALKLSLDETLDLLSKAGYTLSNSNKFDIIIKYFIETQNYNIFEVNEALFEFDQPTLI